MLPKCLAASVQRGGAALAALVMWGPACTQDVMAVCADKAEGMGTGGSLNPPPGEVFTGGGLSSVGKGAVHAAALLRASPACVTITFEHL